MKTKLVFYIFILLSYCTLGQNTNKPKVNNLGVWKKIENDILKIRWFPAYPTVWEVNNKFGYNIERAEFEKGKNLIFKKLNNVPIKPKNELNANVSNEEIIGNQAVFNKEMQTSIVDLAGNDAANKLNLRHYFAMYASFKSFKTAQNMGLGFEDTSFEKGKKYIYRIFSNHKNSESGFENDTTYIAFNPNEKMKQNLPPRLEKEEVEKAVFLTWPAKIYQKHFALYHIERSQNGKDFERITKAPIAYSNSKVNSCFYKDSIGVNYVPHVYRLVGMDFFGEWHTSKDLIIAQGVDKTPPSQPKIESSKFVGSNVHIKWSMPIIDPDLKGFYITRSHSLNGKAIKISNDIPITAKEFIDTQVNIELSYNYLVYAVDTAGNAKASFPIYIMAKDTIPPAKPIGLKGIVSPKGIVQLTWDKNTEKDLKGYYVYFANDPSHEFSQITHNLLTANAWSDTITLRSLTKKVYYRVVAMDTHFKRSEFSDILEIKRPDIIPPVVPLITKIEVKDSTAIIKWQSSPSNDVVAYNLYKKIGNNEWKILKTFKNAELKIREFEDILLPIHTKYEYAIEVIDDSGLKSEKSPIKTIKLTPPAYLPSAPEPKVVFLNEKKINLLTWKYPNNGNYKIEIYRSEALKDNYYLIGFGSNLKSSFVDSPNPTNNYKYILRARNSNGTYSGWSKEVFVKI